MSVAVGIVVSIGGAGVVTDAHEANIKAMDKTIMIFLIFIDYLIMQGTAQRLALAADGGGESGQKPEGRKLPEP